MKLTFTPLWLAVLMTGFAACNDFDDAVDAGCERNAPWCLDGAEDAGPSDGGADDAGTDAGISDAGSDPDVNETDLDAGACIGRGGWCWRYPSALGVMDVTAIWGRTDMDLYVAGAAGVIAHWDGTRFEQLPFAPALEADDEPTIRIIEPRGSGFLIGGEDMSLWVTNDGGVRLTNSDVFHRWNASTAMDGTVRVLRANTGDLDVVSPAGLVTRVERNWALVDSTEAFIFHAGEAHFATTSSDAGARMQRSDGGFAMMDLTGAPLIDARPTRFALFEGKPVMLFTDGRALQYDAPDSWLELPRFDFGAWIPETHAFHETDAGFEWWAAGQDMQLKLWSSQGPPRTFGTGRSFARASWMSPAGNYWAVGGGGRVLRVNSAEFQAMDLASPEGPNANDLAVDGDDVVVAGDEQVVWVRDATHTWQRLQSISYSNRAAAVRAGRACLVDGEGLVVCSPMSAPAFNDVEYEIPLAELDGGVGADNFSLRGGGIGIWRDGLVRASVGGVVAFEAANGDWTAYNLHRGTVTTDLVAVDGGAWVATGSRQSGTDAIANGRVTHVQLDGTQTDCPMPAPALTGGVYGLAKDRAGGVLAAGQGWAGFCRIDGTYEPLNLNGLPSSAFYMSVYLDVKGGVWLLTRSGVVYRRDPSRTMFERSRSPMTWSDTSSLAAVRITGTPQAVWVGVGPGGVLRKPLP
ncbi:MAG: hypothetical protein ACO1OB_17040 [Archangium sp.]